MSIGRNIKKYRKERKLTQKDLSKMANISRSYLADVENERYNPSLIVLNAIAESLNINTSQLLDGVDSKESPQFETPEEAMEFILKQPAIMGFGGFDINTMDDDQILDFANELLRQLKLISYKYKK
ncbi:putative transcriptional regulator [Gottschalkia purinilytica]|uniref:Putative transcriptional regulator n=1 Tax=Gottschalkia purinilytica TaxID=1503 RepID=A0A0L0WF61_GOTPU|nr:helix-turn-helix transcriptional regulator [Gottschalkia purinilytica]KNF10066.1 putative transcriptional regulator [Gottschalkia purinilytica]